MTMPRLPTSTELITACHQFIKSKKVPRDHLLGLVIETVFSASPKPSNTDFKRNSIHSSDIVVMMSGGAGSTATLWKSLVNGQNPAMLYVSNVYSKSISKPRERAIEAVALGARNMEGSPLATAPEWNTWLSTIDIGSSISDLPRRAKIAIMICCAKEAMSEENELPHLAWGPVNGFEDVLNVMEPWGFTHSCPFLNYDEALHCLAEAEAISDTLYDQHGGKELFKFSAGAMLPASCTDIVCSCWDDETYSYEEIVAKRQNTSSTNPYFSNMCGSCMGCKRWHDTKHSTLSKCPMMWIGQRTEGSAGEQEWKSLPSLRIEKKIEFKLVAPIIIKKQKKQPLVVFDDDENSDKGDKDDDTSTEDSTLEDDEENDIEEDIDVIDEEILELEDYSMAISDGESDYESVGKKKKR